MKNSNLRKKLTVALAGNPNSGKSTIFNRITGENQHIGNYPGVTVDIKEGYRDFNDVIVKFVDLPGTYSLNANSPDELIARNFIIDTKPDLVIDIVDASNLERNLYLAVQLIELGIPMILVFNKWDEVTKQKSEIDYTKLSQLMGVQIVTTVATSGEGIDDLLLMISKSYEKFEKPSVGIRYGDEIEAEIEFLQESIEAFDSHEDYQHSRWFALRLLEQDEEVISKVGELANNVGEDVLAELEERCSEFKTKFDIEPGQRITAKRYEFIASVCKTSVLQSSKQKISLSDKIDRLLTNRFIGIPIFLLIMWLLFQFTFTVGDPLMGLIEDGQNVFSDFISNLLSDGWFKSLLVDGIIAGVGAVVIFLPNILLLFLGMAILEYSGYMVRAAFVMDNLMQKFGLHGKSFVPMIIGFGCSVPALMATRTLESRKDRLITMLVIPFMSCGAKLPVYILLTGAFFAENAGNVIFIIYLIGIVTAVFSALILRKFVLKGDVSPFILELPKYKFPNIIDVFRITLFRGWMYLRKAGTIILAASIVLWFMLSFPGAPDDAIKPIEEKLEISKAKLGSILEQHPEILFMESKLEELNDQASEILEQNPDINEIQTEAGDYATKLTIEISTIEDNLNSIEGYNETKDEIDNYENILIEKDLEYSFGGRIGQGFGYLLTPTGLGDWKIGTALLSGFAAKEVVVATLGTLYSLGDEEDEESDSLKEALKQDESVTPLIAFSLMIFVLMYVPCMAVVGVMKAESGSWKWTFFMILYTTAIAWIASTLVYQIGSIIT